MTLILTQLSSFGVSMVADSAITSSAIGNLTLPSGAAFPTYVRLGAEKIVLVPNKPIAISMWGMGRLGDIPTDLWLRDFVSTQIQPGETLNQISDKLADAASDAMFKSNRYEPGGFHVAGVIGIGTTSPVPIAYHVHRGHDSNNLGRFATHKDFPDGQGLTPEAFLQKLNEGVSYFLFNGHSEPFHHLFKSIVDHIYELGRHGMAVPYPPSLKSHEKLARLIVGVMCDIYSMSNAVASVARPLSSLTIDLQGNVHYDSPLSNVSYV